MTLAYVSQLAKPGLERTQATGQDSSHHILLPLWNEEPRKANGNVSENSEAVFLIKHPLGQSINLVLHQTQN